LLYCFERTRRWYEQMIHLPAAQAAALMKLGNGVVRLLDKARPRRRAARSGAA